jgi:hypothetical protein
MRILILLRLFATICRIDEGEISKISPIHATAVRVKRSLHPLRQNNGIAALLRDAKL